MRKRLSVSRSYPTAKRARLSGGFTRTTRRNRRRITRRRPFRRFRRGAGKGRRLIKARTQLKIRYGPKVPELRAYIRSANVSVGVPFRNPNYCVGKKNWPRYKNYPICTLSTWAYGGRLTSYSGSIWQGPSGVSFRPHMSLTDYCWTAHDIGYGVGAPISNFAFHIPRAFRGPYTELNATYNPQRACWLHGFLLHLNFRVLRTTNNYNPATICVRVVRQRKAAEQSTFLQNYNWDVKAVQDPKYYTTLYERRYVIRNDETTDSGTKHFATNLWLSVESEVSRGEGLFAPTAGTSWNDNDYDFYPTLTISTLDKECLYAGNLNGAPPGTSTVYEDPEITLDVRAMAFVRYTENVNVMA